MTIQYILMYPSLSVPNPIALSRCFSAASLPHPISLTHLLSFLEASLWKTTGHTGHGDRYAGFTLFPVPQ